MEDTEYVVENAIVALINEFIENPLNFNNEKLLHYKFHDFLCPKTSFKIRWEYPTREFYTKKDEILKVDRTSKYRDFLLFSEAEKHLKLNCLVTIQSLLHNI